jgi:hypothetical protein
LKKERRKKGAEGRDERWKEVGERKVGWRRSGRR